MAQDIAVCIDEQGLSSFLYAGSRLVVYHKQQGTWQIIKEKQIALDKQAGMSGLRRQMAEIILFLDQCKIFIGRDVVGVPYFELEKAQCSIWEFEGEHLGFLDYVLEKEEEKMNESKEQASQMIPLPVERGSGDFYLSIKEIQENGGGITSKQVLMSFLRQGKFYSLEVLCNHIPPWLEAELKDSNLIGRVEKIAPTETHIYISKRGCEK